MNKYFFNLTKFIIKSNFKLRLIINLIIFLLFILCSHLACTQGGTYYSCIHLIYILILIAGFYSGILYGIAQGIIAGVILGSFMWHASDLIVQEPPENWLYRTLFFAIMGGLAGIFSVISRAYHKLCERQYLHDAVTNLLNLKGMIKLIKKNNNDYDDFEGVIAISIKQYPEINRAFGLKTAEQLLILIKNQLSKITENQGIIGCFNSCQFIIIINKGINIENFIIKLRQKISQEYTINNISLFIELHYGYALSTTVNNLDELFSKANNAALHSLEKNISHTVYQATRDKEAEENIFIIQALNRALAEKSLKLYYQPKIDLNTQKVAGLEALVRWFHPERGYIAPHAFIAILEKTLLINTFSKWLIDESIGQLKLWQLTPLNIPLAINISMVNFDDLSVIHHLLKRIKESGIPARLIEIELTESAMTLHLDKVADLLKNLQAQGISIAIDDFGTGLSSLKYLFELPINILKIDQIFIQSMIHSSAAEAIVRSAIHLGQELNLKIVAEGIENEQQVIMLRKMKCDFGQGYYLGEPMPAEEMTHWLNKNKI